MQTRNSELCIANPPVANLANVTVSEQQGVRINIVKTSTKVKGRMGMSKTITHLTITADPTNQSNGLWLPYLGNRGPNRASYGTYTRELPLPAAAVPVEFVVTGLFSGCRAASFQRAANTRVRFAHIATCAENPKTAAPVDTQCDEIVANMGGQAAGAQLAQCMKPKTGTIVFWFLSRGVWKKQDIQLGPDVGMNPGAGEGKVVGRSKAVNAL